MKDKSSKKNNLVLKRFIIAAVLMLIVIAVANYVTNENVRTYIDRNILKKELVENSIKSIPINSENNVNIYAYDKYIAVLEKNELKLYDSSSNNIKKLSLEISKPITDSKKQYLVVAENEGKSIYLIKDTNIVWKNEIDGKITKINVNENGYVSVIVTNNTYKTIIYVFNPEGTSLFKKYLSSTLAVSTDISPDNKYLVFGEIDYSGVSVKSNIEVISMELAIKDPKNATQKKYNANQGQILIDVNYADNNNVVAMYDDNVVRYNLEEAKEILKIGKDNIFVDINAKKKVVSFEKESSGLFSFKYKVLIKDSIDEKENIYILNTSIPKNVIANKNVIGMNFGTEVKIINLNGWLIKEYKASKQIKDIVLGTNIAGIIYKDKIEIINF